MVVPAIVNVVLGVVPVHVFDQAPNAPPVAGVAVRLMLATPVGTVNEQTDAV